MLKVRFSRGGLRPRAISSDGGDAPIWWAGADHSKLGAVGACRRLTFYPVMPESLVLNATYKPLSVVSARRALVLVWLDRATMVAAREEIWRSVREDFPVPSVVKLNRFVKVPYHRAVPLTRGAVFARDSGTCQYCGASAENLDHVVPRSRGGRHAWDNVVACCRRRNAKKGNRLVNEAGLSLARQPAAPTTVGWVYTHPGQAESSWRPFLQE